MAPGKGPQVCVQPDLGTETPHRDMPGSSRTSTLQGALWPGVCHLTSLGLFQASLRECLTTVQRLLGRAWSPGKHRRVPHSCPAPADSLELACVLVSCGFHARGGKGSKWSGLMLKTQYLG